MWALNSKVSSPKHSYGVYSYKFKYIRKMKGKGTAKSATETKTLPIDDVSRIVNKVDSMSIENEKDENKNENIYLNRICTKITNKIDLTPVSYQQRDENIHKKNILSEVYI